MIFSEKLNIFLREWTAGSRKISKRFMLVLAVSMLASSIASAGKLEKLSDDFELPWSLEFLNDRQILVTEREGVFKIFDIESRQVTKLNSSVQVWFGGQGGLLDVALLPGKAYQEGDWIYVTYSKPAADGASTALARFKLEGESLVEWTDLFVSNAISDGGRHFGSRIAFNDDGHVFFSSGDRGERDWAQELDNHAGTIIRLNLDGSIPDDNPFVNVAGAMPEIWSYGHRNPQGLYFDRASQKLWSIEHGPRGGDEINLIEKGKNYGWPVISYGKEYWAPLSVGEGTHKEGMEQPKKYYDPSIAPGSLILFRSSSLPELDGSLLSGALKLRHLNVVKLEGDTELGAEQRLFEDLGERIRDVVAGPEGALYFVSDQGNLFRYQ